MQSQKRRGFSEYRIAAALLMVMLLTSSLLAKGEKVQTLVGTVKTIGQNSVTIETKTHQILTVKITNATKFLKQNKPSSLSEMKTGNHVVFRAIPSTDTTSTSTPSAETPSANTSSTSSNKSNTKKDTLSLGLSFTAVQASF